MKKNANRLLGALLCLVFLFALLPAAPAFAEGMAYRHWDAESGTLSFNAELQR